MPGTERLGIAGSEATLSVMTPAEAGDGEVRRDAFGLAAVVPLAPALPVSAAPGDLGGPENCGHSDVLRPVAAEDLPAKR